mmetsp:Transcript_11760/g.24365  ORF Transcript_11760/g.24365 Transcript_11760/m.24365 type:complete len:306 (-) Transcript_11760:383-1300(-)
MTSSSVQMPAKNYRGRGSALQEQAARVLDLVAHSGQECHSLTPVNEAVVIGQREVHDWPRDDVAALGHHRAHLGCVHAEDGALWRVDDGRAQHAAKDAAIADGEGPAAHVVERQLLLLGLLGELRDGGLHLEDGHSLHVPDHGNHQAPRACNGNADVDVVAVDDLSSAVVDDRVHAWDLLQGEGAGLDEGGHESQAHAMHLLKSILVLLSQGNDRGHVHLLEGCKHGRCVLCILQPLCNGLPHPSHLDPTFATGGSRCWRSCGLGRCRCCRLRSWLGGGGSFRRSSCCSRLGLRRCLGWSLATRL